MKKFHWILTLLIIGFIWGCTDPTTVTNTQPGSTELPQLLPPIFNIPGGTYSSDQSVTLHTFMPNAKIFYTQDGSTPTTSSPEYLSPIPIEGNLTTKTIKAIVVLEKWKNSEVEVETFAIRYITASPLFSLSSGNYSQDQTLTLSCSTPGAEIYFTNNGTNPTTTSPTYTGPIQLSGNAKNFKIKAIAKKTDLVESSVVSREYTLIKPFTNYTWENTHTNEDLYPQLGANYIDGTNIYVCTNSKGLAVSTDNGSTWNYKFPFTGNEATYLTSVWASGSTIYVGSYIGLSISTDGGMNWTVKQTTNGLGSNIVHGVTRDNSIIYVSTNVGLSISSNGGNTWINKSSSDGLFTGAAFTAIASGLDIYVPMIGGISISHDGGSTWSNKTMVNGLPANDIFNFFKSGSTLYASTNAGLGISTDDGLSWTTKTTADGLASDSIGAVLVSGAKLFVSTSNGLSVSSNGGTTWTTLTTAQGLASNQLKISSSNSTIIGSSLQNGLSVSLDAGVTWTNKSTYKGIGNNTTRCVFKNSTENKIYVGTDYGLAISADNGTTWTNKTTTHGLSSNLVWGVYATGSTIYAGTYNGISISNDGGATWSIRTTSNGLSTNSGLLINASGSSVFAFSYPGLAISYDGGATFVKKNMPEGIGDTISDIQIDGSNIYVCSDNGLSISNDNGVTWRQSGTFGLTNSHFYCAMPYGTTLYGGTNGNLGATLDEGNNWSIKRSGTTVGLFTSGGTIFAVVDNNLVFSDDLAATWKTLFSSLSDTTSNDILVTNNMVFITGSTGLYISK